MGIRGRKESVSLILMILQEEELGIKMYSHGEGIAGNYLLSVYNMDRNFVGWRVREFE